MRLTKLIITIPEEKYKYIQELEVGNTDYATTRMLYHAVRRGTPIPDNATNGDVIKTMFPDNVFAEERWQDEYGVMNTDIISDNGMSFTDIWWNAPYQKGGMSPEVKEHYEQLAEHYNKKARFQNG